MLLNSDRGHTSSGHRQLEEVSFHSDGAIRNLVSKISILDKLKSLTRKVIRRLFYLQYVYTFIFIIKYYLIYREKLDRVWKL